MTSTKRNGGYRSLFWPIILISVGVIWLLGNTGILAARNLVVLLQLWPLLLIAIGLDLLFGRSSILVGALIGLGTVAIVVVAMLIGPSLGLVPSTEVEHATISEPLGDASSADMTLNLSVGTVNIYALEDSATLIAGELDYVGELDFAVRGGAEKTVTLGIRNQPTNISSFPLGNLFPGNKDAELRWDIGLSPAVPLALVIDGGVGETTLALADLQLTALDMNIGVGDLSVTLPAGEYPVTLDGGVGKVVVTISEGAAVTLDSNGGIGEVIIDVPDGAAVRVEANGGLGDIEAPGGFTQVSKNDDREVWETPGFSDADEQILITFDGGIGGLEIR